MILQNLNGKARPWKTSSIEEQDAHINIFQKKYMRI